MVNSKLFWITRIYIFFFDIFWRITFDSLLNRINTTGFDMLYFQSITICEYGFDSNLVVETPLIRPRRNYIYCLCTLHQNIKWNRQNIQSEYLLLKIVFY